MTLLVSSHFHLFFITSVIPRGGKYVYDTIDGYVVVVF